MAQDNNPLTPKGKKYCKTIKTHQSMNQTVWTLISWLGSVKCGTIEIVLFFIVPLFNLRVNTWTIVPLASLSRPNGLDMSVAWNNTNINLNGDGSVPVMWILIAGIGHKHVAVKLLQENRTQPWAVGWGRAAGIISVSRRRHGWGGRNRGVRDWRRMRGGVKGEKSRLVGRESSEGSDGGSPSAMASDSAQSFPLGLLHCDLLEHAGTLWGQASLSVSFYPSVCFSFDLSSI